MNTIILVIALLLGMAITIVPMYYVDKKYSEYMLRPMHITAILIVLILVSVALYVQHIFVTLMAIGSITVCLGWFAVIGILYWTSTYWKE